MSDSLKQANALKLTGVVLGNAVAYWMFLSGGAFDTDFRSAVLETGTKAVPLGLAAALTALLNAQLSPAAKARLVFWKWRNPLPGSRAFTIHGPTDARVDMPALALIRRKFVAQASSAIRI